ncbi:unnamed protein product [Adineta ricciae]|nr:unnamed protein product [Adineta ricciae]
MTSTEKISTTHNETGAFPSFRSMNDGDTPNEQYRFDSTPPIHSSHFQNVLLSSSSSPSVLRNPSPPPADDLTRADMVGDEMYSKSWFCQVLLKLINFVAPEQLQDEIFANIRQQGDNFLTTNSHKKQELDEAFESELCELWDVSMSADVAHLLIEFNSLDLFNVVLIECKDKRCTEIVLGILSNLACCKRNLSSTNQMKSVAQCIIEHSNLFSTILSILTSDDYSDCPTLVQLFRLIYTLLVRQDTRYFMIEHIQLTFEPLCFILQSCCNKELLEQCSCLLRVLLDECNLFDTNEQNEAAYLVLTSMTTAISASLENETFTINSILENLFNCLQIYTTHEHCSQMLNDHCQIIMKLVETTLKFLVHDDIVQIHGVLLLSCISICNFFIYKTGLKMVTKELLEYFLIIGHACYKEKQRDDHRKHAMRRQRSRTHSHSSNKRKDMDITGKASSNNDNEVLSKSDNPLTNIEWEEDADIEQTNNEDLTGASYALVDEIFLILFHHGLRQETSVFTQLNQDQRELFRKLIKHFCNIEKRLDQMLNL